MIAVVLPRSAPPEAAAEPEAEAAEAPAAETEPETAEGEAPAE